MSDDDFMLEDEEEVVYTNKCRVALTHVNV